MKNCCRLLAQVVVLLLGAGRLCAANLDNGVDPFNLGKGDWIWIMSNTKTALGVPDVQGVIDYEKNKGMQWITVKCGDGGSAYTQFDTDLVTRCHAAGLKVFGWAYAYGNNVQGEINVALNCLSKGADGIIIDAEAQYETNAFNNAKAIKYCQAIRQQYPTRMIAHGPSPSVHFHPTFPYLEFGTYCDVIMPQDYWGYRGITPAQMLSMMDNEFRTNLYTKWSGSATNAIKPICPVAQADQPTVAGIDETTFANLVQADATPLTSAGYHGLSYWDAQEHTADQWTAIGGVVVTLMTNIAPRVTEPPINRCVNQGSNATFRVTAYGAPTLTYQWSLAGTNLAGATNSIFNVTNAQPANAGNYSVVVSNSFGVVTSAVATLTVVAPFPFLQLVYSDDFDTNSSTRWSLFQGSGNGTPDFSTNWAFDYTNLSYRAFGLSSLATTSTVPIAPSTTNGSKVGLKLTVNKNDATASAAGISLYPANLGALSNCVLRFDAWINYAGGPNGETASGTTEMMTCGLNHTGTRVNWLDGVASSSDGTWFAVDGEGGTGSPTVGSYNPGTDYRAFRGNGASGPTHLNFPTSGLGVNGAQSEDVVDKVYRDLFCYPNYESPGTPGKHWVQVELSQYNGLLTWRMNGQVVAQRQNTSSFTSGLPMIGYLDPFASIANPAAENFLLIDNVRVYSIIDALLVATQPTSLTNAPGTTANFSVTVAGTAPVYQWQKNGINLANGGNVSGTTTATLTLTGVTAFDAANYRCVITNVTSAVTSSIASLSVTGPPVVTTQPIDSTNGAGTTASFTVGVGGTPPLSYQWQKSSIDLPNGGNVTGASSATLILSNVSQADAFGYRCVITNILGATTSSVAMLNVVDAPAITLQPQNQTPGQFGATVTFTVGVSGTTPLGYQWFFQGAAINGATNASYVIGSVQNTNIGYYYVIATNYAGSITSTNATLQIGTLFYADTLDADTSAGWFIAANQADTRATWGFDYSLRGDHSGPGVPQNPYYTNTTKALKLEANISSGTVINAISVSPKTLNVTGDFQLRFDAWQNWVGPAPSGGTGSTESITAGIGHPGNIVEVPQTTLNAGVFVAASGDGGVSITSTTTPDYGIYTCLNSASAAQLVSTNSGSYAAPLAGAGATPTYHGNSYYTNITGITGPVLQTVTSETSSTLAGAANQTGTERAGSFGFKWHEVILRKTGTGTGITNISWYIDGFRIATVINPFLPANGTNVSLGYFDAFASVAPTNFQFGLFSNMKVESFTGAGVAPAIASQPANVTNYVGTIASFNVSASSPTTLRYQWQKEGVNLSNGGSVSGATNATLSINNVQPGDAGNYRCVVLNDSSFVTTTNVTLTINPVPVLAPLVATLIQSQATNFSVIAPGATGFQWQRNLVNLSNAGTVSGASTATLALTGVTTNDAGSYSVAITTSGGTVTSGPALLTVYPYPSMAVNVNDTDGLVLAATAPANALYVVEVATNLAPPIQWIQIETNFVSPQGVILYTNETPDAPQFYRLRLP